MRVVQGYDEILENIQTLDNYLKNSDYSEYAKSLIKRGICFIAISRNNRLCFYPCRFLGYAQNSKDKHDKNSEKDGRVAKPIISKILGHRPEPNEVYESEYYKYCLDLGIEPSDKGAYGVKRKFWTA